MAIHYRDIMGVLLLMLVATEAARKFMTIQDLAKVQAEAAQLADRFELSQLAARRHLTPPGGGIKVANELPLLCQFPGKECAPGEEVRCELGRHEGCDCTYIKACFPRASECTKLNATHVISCGF